MTSRRCPVGTEVQTLLIERSAYPRATSARAWARSHGFKDGKVHTSPKFHRIRQRSPKRYRKGSFRLIEFKPGVKAVIGCPRRRRT